MKLNEGRLIAQVLKLATAIKDCTDLSKINSNADGIISICNIIDTDSDIPFGSPPILLQPSEQSNLQSTDIFKGAKEEQQGGNTNT